MEAQTGAGKVSCMALMTFYAYVEERGIERLRLQEGLPYSTEYLDNRTNWIDYPTFLEIERRLASLFPEEPELFYEVGKTIGKTRSLGFLRAISRALISPFQVYLRLPRLMKRFLFRFFTAKYRKTSWNSVRGEYVFDEECPPSEAFLATARGILTSVPFMMGAPEAKVVLTRHSPTQVVIDVEFTEWLGPAHYIKTLYHNLIRVLSLRWRSPGEAAFELEDTNRLLMEKVDDLTEAKAELDRRVRDLSILNAISRAATSELEVDLLLSNAVTVISRELGGAPTVILTEGEEPGLRVGASSGLTKAQKRGLAELAAQGSDQYAGLAEAARVVAPGPANADWVALPMRSRERLLGGVLLQVNPPDQDDRRLFESIAGELAVAMENAISYKVIADLRDNLEIRVHERTAELEDATGKLADTVGRLERTDRAMRDFFTNVSHEFKTPLTLILAPLDELERSLREAGQEDNLGNIQVMRSNANNLLRLVTEILDSASLDARQMPLQLEALELSRFVEDVVVALRPLAERKEIDLTCRTPEEEVPVRADAKQLRRALVNLITNAVKYCETGDQVTATVSTEGERVAVEVADTGPGIPDEQQVNVFERFRRASDSRGRIIEGSGIGLAMVKEIATLHGGGIELESEVGRGSIFRLVLPSGPPTTEGSDQAVTGRLPDDELVQRASDEQLRQDRSPPPGPTPAAEGRAHLTAPTARVLLVEDNPQMRGFIGGLLGQRYQVLTAEDGEEGLAAAREELPDLVLSDVMMPRLNGHEMCRLLKDDPQTSNIPVVLISARHGTEAALDGFSAGADDFVVKPFSAPELLARVAAQLRIRTLTTSLLRSEKQAMLAIVSAGIAHEVLNPVNAVVNAVPPLRRCLTRLMDGESTEKSFKTGDALLGAVEESGRRIHDVIRAFLAFARQDDELRLKPTRLSDGIDSVLSILGYRLSGRATIHRNFYWDEPLMCYPNLVGQAVMNLVLNALDAVAEGRGGNVWIETSLQGETVRIGVRDDGPGIPQEDRERVFAPFYTTKAPGAGTGLGLAISREIAALHGGSVELVPSDSGGAELVIAIPYHPVVPSDTAGPALRKDR